MTKNLKNTEIFFVPKGTGVELFATTLHYAPCGLDPKESYQMVCVLPKGTNGEKPNIKNTDSLETKMCFGSNKWLLSHPDSDDAKKGAYVGLTGENIKWKG